MRFGSMRELFSPQMPETFIKQTEIVTYAVPSGIKQIQPAYQLRIGVLNTDAISRVDDTFSDIGQPVIALRSRVVTGNGT